MTTDDQNILSYYWKQFEDEIKGRSEFYEKSVRMILTIPLFVNAGAAISLTSFYSNPNPDLTISLATISFVCGTVFGILTLIFEYFAAYFSQLDFHKYLNYFKSKAAKGQEEMLEELKKHYDGYFDYLKKIQGTVLLRIINGSISIFFCFLGIYFIAVFLLNNYYIPSGVFGFLIIYFVIALIWMKAKFKSDSLPQ